MPRALAQLRKNCAHPAAAGALGVVPAGQPGRPGSDSFGYAPVAVGAAGTPGGGRRRRPAPQLCPPSPATPMCRAVACAGSCRRPGGRPNTDRVTQMRRRERGRQQIRRSHPTPKCIWPNDPPLDNTPRRCEGVPDGVVPGSDKGLRRQ